MNNLAEAIRDKDLVYRQYNTSDATTAAVFWKPAGGTRFYITDCWISTDTAGTVTLYDGSDTLAVFYFAANGGMVSNNGVPLKSKQVNNYLKVKHSASGNISVTAIGFER